MICTCVSRFWRLALFHYHASCVSLKAVPLLVYRPDIREPMTAVLPVVRARRSGLDTKVGIIGSGAEVRPCFKCKRIDLRYLSPLFPDA